MDVAIVPGYDVAKDVTDLAAERGVSIAPLGARNCSFRSLRLYSTANSWRYTRSPLTLCVPRCSNP